MQWQSIIINVECTLCLDISSVFNGEQFAPLRRRAALPLAHQNYGADASCLAWARLAVHASPVTSSCLTYL
jgi:hypothetical protein